MQCHYLTAVLNRSTSPLKQLKRAKLKACLRPQYQGVSHTYIIAKKTVYRGCWWMRKKLKQAEDRAGRLPRTWNAWNASFLVLKSKKKEARTHPWSIVVYRCIKLSFALA
jgi:hypothetical protein